MWDPDGAGPQSAKLVVGGEFWIAGDAFASNLALYDPASGAWSALGSGMDSIVLALTTLPNGDLIAGGEFTTAGDYVSAYWARWVCPQPDVACCFPNGTCQMLTAADCTQTGGTPGAYGSTCTPNTCPQPGACCFPGTHCEMSTVRGSLSCLSLICHSTGRCYLIRVPPSSRTCRAAVV